MALALFPIQAITEIRGFSIADDANYLEQNEPRVHAEDVSAKMATILGSIIVLFSEVWLLSVDTTVVTATYSTIASAHLLPSTVGNKNGSLLIGWVIRRFVQPGLLLSFRARILPLFAS